MIASPFCRPKLRFLCSRSGGLRFAAPWLVVLPTAACSLMVSDELSDKASAEQSESLPDGAAGDTMGAGGAAGSLDSGVEAGFGDSGGGNAAGGSEDASASGGSGAAVGEAGIDGGITDAVVDASDQDALVCGTAPEPPGSSSCPVPCDDCDLVAGVCVIDCAGHQTCQQRDIDCPSDWRCTVSCPDTQSCEGAHLTCPEDFACSVACTGDQSCKNMTIESLSGPLTLGCQDNLQACEDTNVLCGTNLCHVAPCPTDKLPTVHCNDSCDCVSCS